MKKMSLMRTIGETERNGREKFKLLVFSLKRKQVFRCDQKYIGGGEGIN